MINTFAPAIYKTNWYNGDEETNKLYISDKNSVLIGMPRIRQLRIEKGEPWLIMRWTVRMNQASFPVEILIVHDMKTRSTCPVDKSPVICSYAF